MYDLYHIPQGGGTAITLKSSALTTVSLHTDHCLRTYGRNPGKLVFMGMNMPIWKKTFCLMKNRCFSLHLILITIADNHAKMRCYTVHGHSEKTITNWPMISYASSVVLVRCCAKVHMIWQGSSNSEWQIFSSALWKKNHKECEKDIKYIKTCMFVTSSEQQRNAAIQFVC